MWESDNVVVSSHCIACNFLLFKVMKSTAQGIFDTFFLVLHKHICEKKLTELLDVLITLINTHKCSSFIAEGFELGWA